MKKYLAGALIALLLLSGCGPSADPNGDPNGDPGGEPDVGIEVEGALVLHSGDDFSQGTLDNVELKGGALVLTAGATEGTYESPILLTEAYKELIASWNAKASMGTFVEVLVQTRVEGAWSPWFTYGKWSEQGNEGSKSQQAGNYTSISIDVVEISMGREADALRYRVILTRPSGSSDSPEVNRVAASLRLWDEVAPVLDPNKNWQVELDVPGRSQMIVPEIGNVICSPTSMSMVLEYYGHDIPTTEVAAAARDNGAGIYGNWVYNVAYAGSLGLTAYVERFASTDQIKDLIADGIPVVCSINTPNQAALEGSPMGYPSGHLLVVRGFTVKNGVEYVIVNDPAAPNNETVRREYKLTEFRQAWRNVSYVITDY